MTFAEAKTIADKLSAEVTRTGEIMNTFPKDGPFGMASDAVRASSEWKFAKREFDAAFAALRKFNGEFTKTFAKEMREERRTRRAG